MTIKIVPCHALSMRKGFRIIPGLSEYCPERTTHCHEGLVPNREPKISKKKRYFSLQLVKKRIETSSEQMALIQTQKYLFKYIYTKELLYANRFHHSINKKKIGPKLEPSSFYALGVSPTRLLSTIETATCGYSDSNIIGTFIITLSNMRGKQAFELLGKVVWRKVLCQTQC